SGAQPAHDPVDGDVCWLSASGCTPPRMALPVPVPLPGRGGTGQDSPAGPAAVGRARWAGPTPAGPVSGEVAVDRVLGIDPLDLHVRGGHARHQRFEVLAVTDLEPHQSGTLLAVV